MRFYGLVKSNYLPSLTTLDILSKYCGFNPFDEFMELKSKKYTIKKGNYPGSILNYLGSLFRETYVKESEDRTFNCVEEETIMFLRDIWS